MILQPILCAEQCKEYGRWKVYVSGLVSGYRVPLHLGYVYKDGSGETKAPFAAPGHPSQRKEFPIRVKCDTPSEAALAIAWIQGVSVAVWETEWPSLKPPSRGTVLLRNPDGDVEVAR